MLWSTTAPDCRTGPDAGFAQPIAFGHPRSGTTQHGRSTEHLRIFAPISGEGQPAPSPSGSGSPFFAPSSAPSEHILSDSSVGGGLLGEMQLFSDVQLLEQYARQGSEAAFGEIVVRYADLVYSAALRQLRSPEAARDVTQTVFMDLARKSSSLARKLPANGAIIGWLYRSTRFAALNFIRKDQRRQNTERQVMDNPTKPGCSFSTHGITLLR